MQTLLKDIPFTNNHSPSHNRPGETLAFALTDSTHPLRQALEHYIAEQYRRCFEADIHVFAPLLLSMWQQIPVPQEANDGVRDCIGAIGLREARSSRLFLEAYLEQPIEQAIAQFAKQPVARDPIVEVGNLVATQKGGSLWLFVVMAAALEQAGFVWMTFTATAQVSKLIQRLQVVPHTLAQADYCRLGDKAGNWGRYYQHCPQVMAVDLVTVMPEALHNPLIRQLLQQNQDAIDELATRIRHYRQVEINHAVV